MSIRSQLTITSSSKTINVYTHNDGQLQYTGLDYLKFLKETNLENLKNKFLKLQPVTGNYSQKHLKLFKHYLNLYVDTGKSYYSLLREAQGVKFLKAISADLTIYEEVGTVPDAEYKYLIDFNNSEFSGFDDEDNLLIKLSFQEISEKTLAELTKLMIN